MTVEIAESSLLGQYMAAVQAWERVLAIHYPSADRHLSIARDHRVFRHGNRCVKAQYVGTDSLVADHQRVDKEYELHARASGAAYDFHPAFRELEPGWISLELDWVDGRIIQDFLKPGLAWRVSVVRLLWKVAALSLRGVVHPQLRPRHILVKDDGDMAFIDLGGGHVTSVGRAFAANFGLLGGLRRSPLAYFLKTLLLVRLGFSVPATRQPPKVLSAPIRMAAEKGQLSLERKDLERLLAVEDAIIQVLAEDPGVFPDVPSLAVGPTYLVGSEPWEAMRRVIWQQVPFQGRRVLIFGSKCGLSAIFAQAAGAEIVAAYESHPGLRNVAHLMADLMGTPEIRFASPPDDPHNLGDGIDLALCLDRRHDEVNQMADLEALRYIPDVVFRTSLTTERLEALVPAGKRVECLFEDDVPVYRIHDT